MTVPPGPRAIEALQLRLRPMAVSDVAVTMNIGRQTASLHINRALRIIGRNPKHSLYHLVQQYDDTDWAGIKPMLKRPELTIERALEIITDLKTRLKDEKQNVESLRRQLDAKIRALEAETFKRRELQKQFDGLWMQYEMIPRKAGKR